MKKFIAFVFEEHGKFSRNIFYCPKSCSMDGENFRNLTFNKEFTSAQESHIKSLSNEAGNLRTWHAEMFHPETWT